MREIKNKITVHVIAKVGSVDELHKILEGWPEAMREEGNQGIFVFDILSEDLSAGFSYIEVDAAKAGTAAQLGAGLLIPHDLLSQRSPANLAALSA